MGGKFVLFYIGPELDQISVHEKKLRQHSLLFENALKLPKNEFVAFLQRSLDKAVHTVPGNGAIVLAKPEFRIRDMNVLVEWIYTSCVPAMDKFKDFHCLYFLAAKFQMPGLLNHLMDYIQEYHKASLKTFAPKQIGCIFDKRAAGDGKLWSYCASQTVGALIWGKKKENWLNDFERLCNAKPNLRSELFQVLVESGRSIVKHAATYRKRIKKKAFDPCHFHIHAPGQKCGNEGGAEVQNEDSKESVRYNETSETRLARQ